MNDIDDKMLAISRWQYLNLANTAMLAVILFILLF